MAKLAIFLPFICALVASSVARVQFVETPGANAILEPPEAPVKAESAAEKSLIQKSAENAQTFTEDGHVVPIPPTVEDILPPDQWPTQVFKPMKEIANKGNPVEVLIPSSISVKPPTNFTNKIKFSDFNIPDFPMGMGADQRVEYYPGLYSSGEEEYAVLVKQAIPGFENILYQEAQVMQALADKNAFPQLIHYDGRNLTMTTLCSNWAQVTAVEFQAGGMDLEYAYNMMHQVLDALKELHSEGFVHRDISATNIAYGCYYYKDVLNMKAPFKLSETSKLYIHDFGTTENINESNLNKYYYFAGSWDFVSNATMHDEEPMFVQDAESLGYVLIYGLNGGLLSWSSMDGTINLEDNIAKKAALDLDVNLARMGGDEKTIAKAKRDITKYFRLIREHTLHKPKEPLDYEALKACFNINDYPSLN